MIIYFKFLQLWFPLYSVLRHQISSDVAAYKLSIIQRHVESNFLLEFNEGCFMRNFLLVVFEVA